MKVTRGKNFSSKVLKIELEGPNRSYFGILDVPGIFRAKTVGITEEERKGVEKFGHILYEEERKLHHVSDLCLPFTIFAEMAVKLRSPGQQRFSQSRNY